MSNPSDLKFLVVDDFSVPIVVPWPPLRFTFGPP